MTAFAVSNIALTAHDHTDELRRLPALGITGLEVAPSRVWSETWHGLRAKDVEAYRRAADDAGPTIVGLHSLLFDHPELGLFEGPEVRAATLDFLVHLSEVCRDLGGRTLIWGGGRRRGAVPAPDALAQAVDFCRTLTRRIEDHGTCYCFEPLGPCDSDFINSALEALALVTAVDHPALRVQLDAKALVENDEVDAATFEAVAPMLVHVHANEPGLAVLGSSGAVDHAAIGRHLNAIGYDGFVSIEQRMMNSTDPLADVALSAAVVRQCYGREPREDPAHR